jgi:hypothetical protein
MIVTSFSSSVVGPHSTTPHELNLRRRCTLRGQILDFWSVFIIITLNITGRAGLVMRVHFEYTRGMIMMKNKSTISMGRALK